jgi:hypothetical protein
MARLIPDITVDEIPLKPERDVARALVGQLPNDVTVYHSYPWLHQDRHERTGDTFLSESETDFLILSPKLGLLALEVKGGDIRYDSGTRRWYRQLGPNEKDIKDPIVQVGKNLHRLVERISSEVYSNSKPSFPFGYAAIFPDCRFNGGPPPGAQPVIIFSADDLTRIEKRISNALREWSRGKTSLPIPSDELKRVKRSILPEFDLYPILSRTIEEQEERFVRLTRNQMELLEFLGGNHRAAIEGVAGSGKTLVAKAQVSRLAADGRRTLFLCYNRRLAEWVRDSIPQEERTLVEVHHFHGLCLEFCKRAKVPFDVPQDDSAAFWSDEAPNLLLDALDILDDRFDAVVVDEGQDFRSNWWDAIDLINRQEEQGTLYVFYDPIQNLYVDGRITIPSLGSPHRLPVNCRNTRSIANTCELIIESEIRTRPETPDGTDTRVEAVETDTEFLDTLKTWTKEWFNQQGIRSSQMAILSPFKKQRSVLADVGKIGSARITEDLEEWRRGEGILFSTIRSFKGLEADIVILLDVVEPNSIPTFTKADFYVASSRAKHLLRILVSKENASAFRTYGGKG